MSIAYFDDVLRIIQDSEPLRNTIRGVAKQTGCAAAGTAAGGLLLGPFGALAGGIMGAIYGYQCSDDYDNLMCCVRSMTDKEKQEASAKIQRLVGSASIDDFVRYIATEAQRELLLKVLMEIIGRKMSP